MQTETQVQDTTNETAQTEVATTQETAQTETAEASTEQTTETAGESTQQQADEDKAKPAKSSGVQKRIDELVFKKNEAEREAAYWRAQAQTNKAPDAPKASDYSTQEDYDQALADHRVEARISTKLSERDLSVAKQHESEAKRATAEAYGQRLAIATAKIPDFAEVVGKSDLQVSDGLIEALQEIEFGPEIVYNLVKNPSEALRLSQLSQRQLDRELGRIEALMSTQAPAARTTKAPAPASVSTTAKTPIVSHENMTVDQIKADMKARGSKWVR